MTDINALKVLGRAIRAALEPKADDYQGEACAIFAAIRADTGQGAALRPAVLGLAPTTPHCGIGLTRGRQRRRR